MTQTLLLDLEPFLDILDFWAIHIFFLFTFYTLPNELPAFYWSPFSSRPVFHNKIGLQWIISRVTLACFLLFSWFTIL